MVKEITLSLDILRKINKLLFLIILLIFWSYLFIVIGLFSHYNSIDVGTSISFLIMSLPVTIPVMFIAFPIYRNDYYLLAYIAGAFIIFASALIFIKKVRSIFFKALDYPYPYALFWGALSVSYSYPLHSKRPYMPLDPDLFNKLLFPARMALNLITNFSPNFFKVPLTFAKDLIFTFLAVLICFVIMKAPAVLLKKIYDKYLKSKITNQFDINADSNPETML